MIRNVRILVDTVEQAKAVQEYLFANGCMWSSGDNNVRTLYPSPGEKISMFVRDLGNITWGGDDSFTARHNSHMAVMEFTFETQEVVKSVKTLERAKTLLFGRMYYSDELQAALDKLEVVA